MLASLVILTSGFRISLALLGHGNADYDGSPQRFVETPFRQFTASKSKECAPIRIQKNLLFGEPRKVRRSACLSSLIPPVTARITSHGHEAPMLTLSLENLFLASQSSHTQIPMRATLTFGQLSTAAGHSKYCTETYTLYVITSKNKKPTDSTT